MLIKFFKKFQHIHGLKVSSLLLINFFSLTFHVFSQNFKTQILAVCLILRYIYKVFSIVERRRRRRRFHIVRVFHVNFNWWSFTGVWVTLILFRPLLSILADLKVVICMVFILSLISISSNLLSKPLGTIPSVPTTIGITITFYSFLCSLARSKYLSVFSPSFIFTLLSAGTLKSSGWQVCFFLLTQSS